jgi:hypothetical protein
VEPPVSGDARHGRDGEVATKTTIEGFFPHPSFGELPSLTDLAEISQRIPLLLTRFSFRFDPELTQKFHFRK